MTDEKPVDDAVTSAGSAAVPSGPTAAVATAGSQPSARSSWIGRLARWEALLLVVLLIVILAGSLATPFLLTGGNFANLSVALIEVSIMAIPMALIVIAGEIDLSVESMVGLSSSVLGFLWAAGVPLPIGIVAVLAMGAAGGLVNGLLVTRAGLPSLVVTLGTLALYRGLALVVLGPQAVSDFPDAFTNFGYGTIPGTSIPWPLVVFVVVAVILGLVLHATWAGREIFAVGKNPRAAQFSGVRVARLKTVLFVISGAIAALAGVILTARFASARADAGQGMTLTVVTIVLLGGVNIFGGSGSIPGVVLAAATLAVLENVLRLVGVSSDIQGIVVGVLLIVSVSLPNVAHQVDMAVVRARAGRPPPARSNDTLVRKVG
jgi:rhamnose transport system permease protein